MLSEQKEELTKLVGIKDGETLLPAGSKFKVLQNKLDKKGVVRLVLKYLK